MRTIKWSLIFILILICFKWIEHCRIIAHVNTDWIANSISMWRQLTAPRVDDLLITFSFPFSLKMERFFVTFWMAFNQICRSGLGKMFASRPTCLTFRRNSNLVVGTASGHILELNVSMPSSPRATTASTFPMLIELGAHERAVRKVVVCPHDDSLVASCADQGKVVVSSVDPAHPSILWVSFSNFKFN